MLKILGTPTHAEITANGQNVIDDRGQDVVIDFQPNFTEGPINGSLTNVEPGNNNISTTAETQNRNEVVQQNVTEQDVLIAAKKNMFRTVMKWNTLSFAVFLTIMLAIKNSVPYRSVFVVFWIYNIYNIIIFTTKNGRPL